MKARVLFFGFMLVLLVMLVFAGTKAGTPMLPLFSSLVIGGAVGYLIARVFFRLRPWGGRRMILLRAWLLHVVLVATLFSAELLFGAPDWSSGNAGTFTFGLLFSCPLGFWSSLTVMIEGGSENASRDRMSLMLSTLGLQLGGFVVGVLVGLALTVYLISPLIRYVEG